MLCQFAEPVTKAVQTKRPGKLAEGVLFHQDKTSAHKAFDLTTAAYDCDFGLVDHSVSCPDFAPSNYCLLPNMIKYFVGNQHRNGDDIMSTFDDFYQQYESFFTNEIEAPTAALTEKAWTHSMGAF